MKIAIVGAGVSGLVAAHLLQREHEIALFEAAAYAGGHTNTVRVDTADATHHVDTGFIVFNDRNYPNFERLLAQLGVATQTSSMSFGVSDGLDFEYNGASANGLFANRGHLVKPWFHRMIADLVRFNRDALALLRAGEDGPSLGHWLEERRYSRMFVERLIVPQASAVWSADPRTLWSFPARFLLEFFDNHGVLGFPSKVLRTISYAHPVFTAAGSRAQARVNEVSGRHARTHFCGAYWGWGFHEDGVVSALRVARSFGAAL